MIDILASIATYVGGEQDEELNIVYNNFKFSKGMAEQWLQDGVRIIINEVHPSVLLSLSKSKDIITNPTDLSTLLGNIDYKIVSVLRYCGNYKYVCREILPSQIADITNKYSLSYATALDPAFCTRENVLTIYPEANGLAGQVIGELHYIQVPTVNLAESNSIFSADFEALNRLLVIYGAARLYRECSVGLLNEIKNSASEIIIEEFDPLLKLYEKVGNNNVKRYSVRNENLDRIFGENYTALSLVEDVDGILFPGEGTEKESIDSIWETIQTASSLFNKTNETGISGKVSAFDTENGILKTDLAVPSVTAPYSSNVIFSPSVSAPSDITVSQDEVFGEGVQGGNPINLYLTDYNAILNTDILDGIEDTTFSPPTPSDFSGAYFRVTAPSTPSLTVPTAFDATGFSFGTTSTGYIKSFNNALSLDDLELAGTYLADVTQQINAFVAELRAKVDAFSVASQVEAGIFSAESQANVSAYAAKIRADVDAYAAKSQANVSAFAAEAQARVSVISSELQARVGALSQQVTAFTNYINQRVQLAMNKVQQEVNAALGTQQSKTQAFIAQTNTALQYELGTLQSNVQRYNAQFSGTIQHNLAVLQNKTQAYLNEIQQSVQLYLGEIERKASVYTGLKQILMQAKAQEFQARIQQALGELQLKVNEYLTLTNNQVQADMALIQNYMASHQLSVTASISKFQGLANLLQGGQYYLSLYNETLKEFNDAVQKYRR